MSAITTLSQREQQVLDRVAAGQRSKTIAHELGLSLKTVEKYRGRMVRKLGASNSAEAVRLAMEAAHG